MTPGTATRPVRWPEDAAAIHRLLAAGWRAGRPETSLHPGDLYWRAGLRDLADLQVWEDGSGEIVGFVELDSKDSSCDIAVAPGRAAALELELFAWAETAARRRGDGRTFIVGCFDGNEERAARLRSLGFEPTDDFYPHHLHPLDGPLPSASRRDGDVVRPLREDELAARVELGGAAFGSTALTVEKLRRIRTGPGYDPDLDLVAVDGAGALAAFALFWFDPHERLGQLEPLGCHPDHQRRGLARTLIEEGLRRLRDRGTREALVVTGGKNAATRSLYEECGFRPVAEDRDWSKRIRGTDA